MKKTIVELAWSSTDGYASFHAVYDDGTVARTEVRPEIATSDQQFLRKKKLIEKDWVGRKVDFF